MLQMAEPSRLGKLKNCCCFLLFFKADGLFRIKFSRICQNPSKLIYPSNQGNRILQNPLKSFEDPSNSFENLPKAFKILQIPLKFFQNPSDSFGKCAKSFKFPVEFFNILHPFKILQLLIPGFETGCKSGY